MTHWANLQVISLGEISQSQDKKVSANTVRKQDALWQGCGKEDGEPWLLHASKFSMMQVSKSNDLGAVAFQAEASPWAFLPGCW